MVFAFLLSNLCVHETGDLGSSKVWLYPEGLRQSQSADPGEEVPSAADLEVHIPAHMRRSPVWAPALLVGFINEVRTGLGVWLPPGPVAPGAPPRPHRQPPEAPAPRRAPPPPASVPAAAPAPPPPPPPRPSTSSDKPRQIPTTLLGNSGGGGSNKSRHLPKNPDDTATFYAVF